MSIFSFIKENGTTVSVSSVYSGIGPKLAENAIDGVYNDEGSMAHTKRELSPWIQIHLTDVESIQGVKIWNRCEVSTGETNHYA